MPARQVVLAREAVRRHQQIVGRVGRRTGRLLLLEARGAAPVHLRVGLVLVLVAAAAIGEVGLRRRPLRRVREVRCGAVMAGVASDTLVLAGIVERLHRSVAAEAGRRVERCRLRGRLGRCRGPGSLRERRRHGDAECGSERRDDDAPEGATHTAIHRIPLMKNLACTRLESSNATNDANSAARGPIDRHQSLARVRVPVRSTGAAAAAICRHWGVGERSPAFQARRRRAWTEVRSEIRRHARRIRGGGA